MGACLQRQTEDETEYHEVVINDIYCCENCDIAHDITSFEMSHFESPACNHILSYLMRLQSDFNMNIPPPLIAIICNYCDYLSLMQPSTKITLIRYSKLLDTPICQNWWDQKIKSFHGGQLKICLLGDAGVGKSSIVGRYVSGDFEYGAYDPTIEDSYKHTVDIGEGQQVVLDILDTAGGHSFMSMAAHWIKCSDIYLLVFSFKQQHSLKALGVVIEQIVESNGNLKNCILIGNKADSLNTGTNALTATDVTRFCEKWDIPFLKASCMPRYGWQDCIEDMFSFSIKYYWVCDSIPCI